MPDEYQRGSDVEWLEHSNEELAREVKKRGRQTGRARCVALVLLLALGWVVFKFLQQHPVQELWRF
jgi:uncharacterized protein HemX